VGIALDDVEQARDFAAELGIDYPILVGSTDVMTAVTQYGNRSGILPYSVLLDRQGIIRWIYLGELKENELREQISRLLNERLEEAA
jgi:peroxiredoxin